jgi:histone deacetylase 6
MHRTDQRKTDVVKTYVDWAAKQGFSVIDLNLPRHATDIADAHEHEDSNTVEYRTKEATDLLTYLWDNYIEINDATHVFLMGTNTGHGAIINFIKAHEDRAVHRITRAISFVEDVPLQSCKSATNEDIARWYYEHSLVFVNEDHNFWSSEFARKIKKRFGRLYKSRERFISNMLSEHKDEVTEWLSRDTAGWQSAQQASEDEDMAGVTTPDSEPMRRPPIGNFALSPPKNADFNRTASPRLQPAASPRERTARSPRLGSPPKQPPIGNFALSPRAPSSRSPAR